MLWRRRTLALLTGQALALVIALAGFSTSVGAFVFVRHELDLRRQIEFEWVAHNRAQALKRGIDDALNGVRLVGRFMASASATDQTRFAAFAGPMFERSPGVLAIEWVPRVPAARRDAFERAASIEIPDYRIRSAPADEHFPVRFLVTGASDKTTFGFDFAANEDYRTVMDQARNSGAMAVSERVELVHRGESELGFLVFEPVYSGLTPPTTPTARRESLRGFVVGYFDTGDLAKKSISLLEPRGVELLVLDESASGDARFLDFYASRLSPSPGGMGAPDDWRIWPRVKERTLVERFPVADREWSITSAQTPEFRSAEGFANAHWFVLVAGFAVTSAFSAAVFQINKRVAERLRMGAELEKSEQRLRVLFDQFPDIIMNVDKEGLILLGNRPMGNLAIPTAPGGKSVKLDSTTFLPPFLRSWYQSALWTACRTGEASHFEFADDSENWWELRILPIQIDDHVREALVLATDVSERKQLEARSVRNAQLASLGVLATTVAHEINNPNNAIRFNAVVLERIWIDVAALLNRHRDSDGDYALGGMDFDEAMVAVPKLLSGIDGGSARIETIVADLRHMTRKDPIDGIVDIQAVIEGAAGILQYQIARHTDRFTLDLPDGLPLLRGSPVQLEQVFINLIMNALQALADREAAVRVSAWASADRSEVVVEVSDQGPGIPRDILDHVFEPFFTTKDVDQGMGMGLSIANDIVRYHGGEIAVQSAPGEGTSMVVTLPVGRGAGKVEHD